MTTNTATEQDEQALVVAEIFANMMADANKILRDQNDAMQKQMNEMQRQMNASTVSMRMMLQDAMLNVCASTGLEYDTVLSMANNKALAIDANGHSNDNNDIETEGGSAD
jgi:hypothetical protein